MKKLVYLCAAIAFFGIFAFSAWKLVQIGSEYKKGEQEYENLAQYVVIPETTQTPAPQETLDAVLPEAPVQPQEPLWPQVDFAALQMINPDVVGWIYIPDTKVNYPIVQGSDNDQYLKRLISGEYNSSGSIFLDANCSSLFLSRNNPIYGHNMKNGTMFADVTGYVSQEFYDDHPVAMLVTPGKNYQVKLFSAYTTDAWGDAWTISFTDSAYAQWLEERQRKSYFAADVIPTAGDTVLTFSTCTYETDDARFVVHGILEEYTGN